MVTIKFAKKDSRIMKPEHYKFIGKECAAAEWMAHSMIRTAKRLYPDALASIEVNFSRPIPRYDGENLDGARVLVYRGGGAGDLIMLTPAIKKLKDLYPTASFDLVTQKKFHDIVRVLAPFDSALEFPILKKNVVKYDYYISYAGTIEDPTHMARNVSGIDIFAKFTPVALEDGERVVPFVENRSHTKRVGKMLKRKMTNPDNKILTIQFRPSNVNRAFDVFKMANIVKIVSEIDDLEIFIVGGDDDECPFNWHIDDKPHPRIHKVIGELSWGETIALVRRSDLCLGADSSLTHIAGMESTPCIGLFGPIPWELRVNYYPNSHPIYADYPCAPCFCHGDNPCTPLVQKIQEYKKEHEKQPAWMAAPCWDSIGEEQVITKILDILYEGEITI